MSKGERPQDRKKPEAGTEEISKAWGTPIGQDCIKLEHTSNG